MTPLPRLPLLASLLLLGCVPLPTSLGEGLDTDTDAAASGDEGSGSSDGTDHDDGVDAIDPEPKWELMPAGFTTCTDLSPTPEGGVAVLLGNPDAEGFISGRELRRYAADGALLWQWSEGIDLVDATTLADGRILIGGSVSDAPRQAALWLLAPDGELEASYVQPLDGTQDDTLVRNVAASASTIAFVILRLDGSSPSSYDPLRYEVGVAGFDLVPQWWAPQTDDTVDLHSVQIAASGSIRTLQFEFDSEETRMLTYSAAGLPEGDEIISPTTGFASGEPGVVIGRSVLGLHVHGLEEATFDQLLVPALFGNFLSGYHQDGVLIAGSAPEGLGSRVLRLDADGTTIYDRTLEPIVGPYVVLHDAAAGPEDSVYLCGSEFEEGLESSHAFVSRRYPQWQQ